VSIFFKFAGQQKIKNRSAVILFMLAAALLKIVQYGMPRRATWKKTAETPNLTLHCRFF
jgi:hypothetical protein